MKSLLSLVIVIVLCASFRTSETDPLRESRWVLTSIYFGDKNNLKKVPEKVSPYLMFEDSVCNGHSGCNDFSAKYKIKGDSIWFSSPFSTLIYCHEINWIEEALLHQLMPGKSKCVVNKDTLTFYSRHSHVFTFKRTGAK